MPKRCWVASGTDIQNLYQAYWISRGASAEGKLTLAIMFNFTGNILIELWLNTLSLLRICRLNMIPSWISWK